MGHLFGDLKKKTPLNGTLPSNNHGMINDPQLSGQAARGEGSQTWMDGVLGGVGVNVGSLVFVSFLKGKKIR